MRKLSQSQIADLQSVRDITFGMGNGCQTRVSDLLRSDWLGDLKEVYEAEDGVTSNGRHAVEVIHLRFN